MFHTLIPPSRELWPMIDSVMPSCCSHMTAAVELATRYTTPDTTVEIGTTSVIILHTVLGLSVRFNPLTPTVAIWLQL